MSTLSNLIFKNKTHYVTSNFGYRKVINTSGGNTSSFHSGVDYGTNGLKIAQYAIADGEILSCGKDTAYANALYVWISYPSLGVKMLHYHLDSYKVKKGQKMKKGDLIGYTGKTGKATGIHLHLGLKKLSGGDYIDAEKWSKEVLDKPKVVKYKITADTLRIRSTNSTKGEILGRYSKGTIVEVKEIKNGWGRTATGWICLDFAKKV